jgi:hypothetical protein
MPINLSSQRTEIVFALLAAAVVSGWRIYKGRAVDLDILMGAFEAFFGGALLPVSWVLIGYPFFQKPPDLSHYMFYIPFAGIGLLFMAFTGIRKALRMPGAQPEARQPSP